MAFYFPSMLAQAASAVAPPTGRTTTAPTTAQDPLQPFYRFLDDFENNTRLQHGPTRQIRPHFNPSFDVRELDGAYHLEGEVAGVEQKDIEIEFTDEKTITVRGHSVKTYTSGTPPSGAIENGKSDSSDVPVQTSKDANSHKASVEDEDAEKAAETTTTTVAATSKDSKGVTTASLPEGKYWVSERSVGEFSRSFTFPDRVDQENVTASLKNGILSITVPKAKKYESRKITVH